MADEQVKKFDKCPMCGSKNRFFEGIVNELKADLKVPLNWNFCYDAKQGAVMPDDKLLSLPVGAEVPGYNLVTDICQDCGCIYAVVLEKTVGKRSIRLATPQSPIPQNRGQRRHPLVN